MIINRVKTSFDLTKSNCSEPSWIAKFLFCKINGTKYATICDTSINMLQQKLKFLRHILKLASNWTIRFSTKQFLA